MSEHRDEVARMPEMEVAEQTARLLVCFFRHGEAVEAEDWAGTEAERPLTPPGTEAIAREGRRLAELGFAPELVLTSDLARASATADVLAGALGTGGKPRKEALLRPGFGLLEFAQLVARHAQACTLLLVGHEPDLSRVVGSLLGGGQIRLRKGGAACLEVDPARPDRGTLVWLVTPQLLGA